MTREQSKIVGYDTCDAYIKSKHKMAKTLADLDRMEDFLKVEEDFSYTILHQNTSSNRWRYWKTRDLLVWS